MGALIAVINKKGENAIKTAVTMLKALKYEHVEAFRIASPITVKVGKVFEELRDKSVNSSILIGHAFSRILPNDEPQLTTLEGATLAFEGRLYQTAARISDVKTFAKIVQHDFEGAIRKTEADFAFALAEPERLVAGRDAMGVRPLYYGENADFVALASERKALWSIGIKAANSFPPGNIALVNKNGFNFKPVKTFAYSDPKPLTMQTAAKKLQKLLQHSIMERVARLKEVPVAFSGGLDSSIIAFLAEKTGADVRLVHVSLKNQPETEHAKKTAEELELPIHIYLFDEGDVEKALPKVLWLIEEPDPLKASIGIPVYWAAQKTAEMGFRVLLAGQGADELFGGYKRYADDYSRYGSEKAHKTMFNDIVRVYETNFERDFKICTFHNVELRLPFATYQIAKFAANLPVELKIESPDSGLRKLVLRQVAESISLPKFVVKKPKRAIQYTSGVSKTLEKLAKREGLSVKGYVDGMFRKAFKKMKHDG